MFLIIQHYETHNYSNQGKLSFKEASIFHKPISRGIP